MNMTYRAFYEAYLHCLNTRNWDELEHYVAEDVRHNGRHFGLSGYKAMLIKDFDDIPDLHFTTEHLVCEPPFIAARLTFDCTPKSIFLGLNVDGRRISFSENVFYQVENDRIVEVWSVIDKAAIEQQLKG